MAKLRTPIIKPRSQGGTFYTFGSALEDVGLNINELKNKVVLSHYVLLDIPSFTAKSSDAFPEGVNAGDYTFAEKFQNYALNMETVLRNQPGYNFAESLTVSERVFWKWMKTEGFMNFVEDEEDASYYVDDSSVVKGFGLISAGAQRTDAYGIYNETFVQIPSYMGKMKVLFKPVEDKNYYITGIDDDFDATSKDGLIENIDSSTEVVNGKLHTGLSAEAIYDDNALSSYRVKDKTEELCVEFSLSELRKYYDNDELTYSDLMISEAEGDFTFNAILVYYSIYDSTGKNILATNAYGLLLLESAESKSDTDYQYPQLTKKRSGTNTSGNSYSFRLNIKTSSVYSGDIKVTDDPNPAFEMSTDFNETIRNLSVAVETLKSNANLISVLTTQSTGIKELVVKTLDKIDDIELDIKNLKSGKIRELKTSSLETDTLSAKYLDSSLAIGDYGKVDGSVFSYQNIDSSTVNTENITAKTIIAKSIDGNEGSLSFGDYANISSKGLHANDFVVKATQDVETPEMTNSDAAAVLDSIIPLQDGNLRFNSEKASTNTSSTAAGSPEDEASPADDTSVSMKSAIGAIITKLKNLDLFDISNIDLDDSSSGAALQAFMDNIQDLQDEVNVRLPEIDSSIAALNNSLDELKDYSDAKFATQEEVDASFGEYKTYVDSSIDAVMSYLDSSMVSKETLDASLNEVKEYIDSSLDNKANKVDVDTSLNELKDYVDSSMASKEYLDTSLNTLVSNIDTSLEGLKTYVDSSVEALKTYTDSSISELKNYCDTTFATKDNVDASFGDIKSYIDASIESLKTYVDSSIASLKSQVDSSISNVELRVDSLEERVDNLSDSLTSTIENVMRQYTQSTEFRNAIETIVNEYLGG